jgi:hypothetical protein
VYFFLLNNSVRTQIKGIVQIIIPPIPGDKEGGAIEGGIVVVLAYILSWNSTKPSI